MQTASSSSKQTPRVHPYSFEARNNLLLGSAGVALITFGWGWVWLTATARGGDANGFASILGIAVVAFVAARLLTRRHGWIASGLLVAAVGGFALLRQGVLTSRVSEIAPLGYSNAAASLFMLASAAALLVYARTAVPALQWISILMAIAFGALPWANQTVTAAVLVTLIPLSLLASGTEGRRATVRVSSVAVIFTFLVTVGLGAAYDGDRYEGVTARMVDATLSERRLMLWHDALDLLRADPLTGVGAGRFSQHSRTAIQHPDTARPHSEALHLAAESGLPGLGFALGLFGWTMLRLWRGGGDVGTAVAVAGIGAVAIQSNIDCVLHYPAVVVAAAVLAGTGSVPPKISPPRKQV